MWSETLCGRDWWIEPRRGDGRAFGDEFGTEDSPQILSPWPLECPPDWSQLVNEPQTEVELAPFAAVWLAVSLTELRIGYRKRPSSLGLNTHYEHPIDHERNGRVARVRESAPVPLIQRDDLGGYGRWQTKADFCSPSFMLRHGMVLDLRRMNPWWEGNPLPVLPETRRHLVGAIHKRLRLRLAPIVVVRGPRQIGKTTAQLHVLQDLLERGVPPTNIFRVQCDELPEISALSEPLLRLVDWFENAVLKKTLNEAAKQKEPTYLFFDEVQNLKDWAPQLKSLVDNSTTQVLVTGSSALRIELGRDSLAGRITTIEAGEANQE